MYMADRHNHPWLSRINKSGLYLGKGKRLIVKNGKLDKNYMITVPRMDSEDMT
jgi:hypothetical protein